MLRLIKDKKKVVLLGGILVIVSILLFKIFIHKELQEQNTVSPEGLANGSPSSAGLFSPSGQYRITNEESLDGAITILDLLNESVDSEIKIIGQDISFIWNPTSNSIAIIYAGRTWITTSLYFVEEKKLLELPIPIEIVKLLGLKYSLAEESYPYIYPIEWSEDGKKLLCAYEWQDVNGMRQNGWFIWKVKENKLQLYLENEPIHTEGPDAHLQLSKPIRYSW